MTGGLSVIIIVYVLQTVGNDFSPLPEWLAKLPRQFYCVMLTKKDGDINENE